MCKYEMIGSTIIKDDCPIFDEDVLTELQSLQALAAERLAMLKRLEWSDLCEDGNACPICEAWEFGGHAKDCALDKLIREGEIK